MPLWHFLNTIKKLQELEANKDRITSKLAAQAKPPQIVPNVEKALQERVRFLEDLPRDCPNTDLMEKDRMAVKAMLGEVAVIEVDDGIVAEVDFGRVYINDGAEERT